MTLVPAPLVQARRTAPRSRLLADALSWNPARNPRGIGAEALLATGNAVYVGMDTDFIGNFKYRRQKLAAFTLAGGYTPPSQDTVSLPGTVYLGGRPSTVAGGVDALLDRSYDGGTNAGTATQGPSSDVLWSNARGAFMAGNTLFYGYQTSSGSYELASRTFDGSTFGPATFVESPYLDPAWAGVPTGSGTSTYDGKLPNFYGTGTSSLANVGGMFYANGRVYYVLKNQAALLYRNFSVDSGIVSGDSFTAIASGFGSAGGMFVSGGFLYVADRNSGNLSRMTFSGTAVGPATVVSGPTVDGQDWRTNALFLGPTPVITVNHPPTASFTYSCSGLNCSFTGSGSDPDGDPLTWAWDFGDGGSAAVQSPSHTYGAAGTFPVTLTVSDNRGGSTPSTQQVAVGQSTSSVGVRGAAGVSASTLKNSLALTVPAGVQAGDGLVLIVSTYSAATGSAPGFTQAFAQVTPGSTAGSTAMTTQVLQKVAGASDAGSTLTVTLSASAKATAQLVAYSGTAPAGPVRTAAGRPETAAGTSHTTPTATATAGDWVLSVWSDRSSNARTWTAPGNVVVRNELDGGASGGEISTLVADSGGPVSGTYGGLVATTSATSSKAADLTVVIAGS